MFHGLKYFKPFIQSASDLSHNIANFLKGVLNTVQPKDDMIARWRLEASLSGRFPEISTEFERFVDADVAQTLSNLDVNAMRVVDLRECAQLLGTSHAGNKPELQDRVQQILQTFNGLFTRMSDNLSENMSENLSESNCLNPSHRYWDRCYIYR